MSRARLLVLSVIGALAGVAFVAAPAQADFVALHGVIGFGPSTPIQGIEVQAYIGTGTGAAEPTSFTAADGSYTLSVPRGTNLSLALRGRYLGNDFTGLSAPFSVGSDRTENITVPFPTRLAATVDESDGTHAVGATIHRPAVHGTGTSSGGLSMDYEVDDDYCVVPEAGWCDLYFFAGRLPYLDITPPGRPLEQFPEETFPGGTVNRTYTLAPTVLLSGVVRSAGGAPLSGAGVTWEGDPVRTTSTVSGAWSIRTVTGPGRLRVTGDRPDDQHYEPFEFRSDSFGLAASRTDDLFVPPLASLETDVVDSVGHPVVGARVAPDGPSSLMTTTTSSGLAGTFALRPPGKPSTFCDTLPNVGGCEFAVFQGGHTDRITVTPPGGATETFPVGPTPDDLNTTRARLVGYATAQSAGTADGLVRLTTSSTDADFRSLTPTYVALPPGFDQLVGRVDYEATVAPGAGTTLTLALPAGAQPDALLRLDTTGQVRDATSVGTIRQNEVTVPARDGGPGDEDGAVNGVIAGSILPVLRDPLVVVTTALPAAAKGKPFSTRLAGSGPGAPYSWSLTDGTLPPGLVLSPDGVISGTATTLGTYRFEVRMRDSTGSTVVATRRLDLTVATIVVATTSVPDGYVGGPYSSTLKQAGGSLPSWRLASEGLPPGLTLSRGGTISGTPTTPGTFEFAVVVSSAGKSSPPQWLTLVVHPMEIATAALPEVVVGTSYAQELTTLGGLGPVQWTKIAGAFPSGVTLSSTGTISGTPTSTGRWVVIVRATDASSPAQTDERSFVLTVTPMQVATTTLKNATKSWAYSATLQATGGVGTLTWSVVEGLLPPGLKLSTVGKISGTPTTRGTWTFTARVADTAGNEATRALTLTVG